MPAQQSRYGTADLVLETPDTRIRLGFLGAAAPQLFLVFVFFPYDFGIWKWIFIPLSILLGALYLLSLTAWQRSHVHSRDQTLRIERSLLRWVWRRETLAFGDVQHVILTWGDDAAKNEGSMTLRKDRPVSVHLEDGSTLVLGSYPSAQDAEHLASELARLVGCPVGGASQERYALRLVGLAPPDPLESVVTRTGDILSIKLSPPFLTRRAKRWLFPYVLGLITAVTLVIGTLTAFTRGGSYDGPWILLTTCVLLILGGFLGWRSWNQRFTPPTLQASRERLELTLPANLSFRHLDWTPFDSTGVSVITLRGKPALRFEPPSHVHPTTQARPTPITLGRGISEDELQWIADALGRALDGRLPSEVPKTSDVPRPRAMPLTPRGENAPKGSKSILRKRILGALFAVPMVGATIYLAYSDPIWRWILLGMAGLAVGFFLVLSIRKNWLFRQRRSKGHTFETFRTGLVGLGLPETALRKLYNALGERLSMEDFPVLATDRLSALYGLNFQYTPPKEREWIDDFCQNVDLPRPTLDELRDLRDVRDLAQLIARLHRLQERET